MQITKSQLRDITLAQSVDDFNQFLSWLNADGVIQVVGDDELDAALADEQVGDETVSNDTAPPVYDQSQHQVDASPPSETTAEPAVDGGDVAQQ
jgi:hypothetical protein